MKREEIIEQCKEELLKHCFVMRHTNGYPAEAVPKATILELPALMRLEEQPQPERSDLKTKEGILSFWEGESSDRVMDRIDYYERVVFPAMEEYRSRGLPMVTDGEKSNLIYDLTRGRYASTEEEAFNMRMDILTEFVDRITGKRKVK